MKKQNKGTKEQETGLNVLVVEDVLPEMKYVCMLIKEAIPSCAIFKGKTVKQAIHLMATNEIDVFFIDVVLPDQSGWCFAKEIREHPNHQLTPIVFITGSQANMSELQRRYHHYDFIEKPYTAQTFQDAVGALLKELDLQKGNGITRPKKKKKVICVEAENGMVTVALDHIFYVEVLHKKMFLYTRTSTLVLRNKGLDAIIHEVNDEYFIRCHKSFGIFLKNVLRIEKEDRRLWKAYFIGCPEEEPTCLISKTYYGIVEKRLKEMREI